MSATTSAAAAAPAPSQSRDDFVPPTTMTETTVAEETDLATLVELLDDDHVRTILAATSTDPMSASELAEYCDVSESTIYRRVDRLREEALVAEQTRPRADGHHDTVYVATLDRFEVELGDDGFECSVKRRGDDMIDQLTRLWEGL